MVKWVIPNSTPDTVWRCILLMAYVITDACVQCGSCKDECPLELISESDGKYVINAGECVECGTCADICPNDAIQAD